VVTVSEYGGVEYTPEAGAAVQKAVQAAKFDEWQGAIACGDLGVYLRQCRARLDSNEFIADAGASRARLMLNDALGVDPTAGLVSRPIFCSVMMAAWWSEPLICSHSASPRGTRRGFLSGLGRDLSSGSG
jgi:hypothetical protein